jgi:hypothetical protein
LQRRNADFLTHGNCTDGNFGPTVHGLGKAASLAGKFNAGLLAEAEAADVVVKALLAQPQPQLDGAHVARFRHHLRHAEQPKRLVVANAQAPDHDGAHLAVNDFARNRELFLQRAGDSHDFEG